MPYGGRPTARETITAMLEDGSLQSMFSGADSEKQIYEALGINYRVWFDLKKEIPQFAQLSTRTRVEQFYALKGAMKKNAYGYDYYEYYDEMDADGNVVKRTRTRRHKAPDLNSQKILLTNIKKAEAINKGNSEIMNWTNRADEPIEIKTEGTVSVVVDTAIKSVLEAVGVN